MKIKLSLNSLKSMEKVGGVNEEYFSCLIVLLLIASSGTAQVQMSSQLETLKPIHLRPSKSRMTAP